MRTYRTGLRADVTGLPADVTGLRAGLTGAEVHAWFIDLDAQADMDAVLSLGVLDRAERDRAASYLRRRDGVRFAASRAWLRTILGRYVDGNAAELRFARAADGRPVLAGPGPGPGGGPHFSLSRSGERALLAVSAAPVGADVERAAALAGLADLVASRFSGAEAACVAGGCGGTPTRGFYRHWTAKEAFLKATGRGLSGLRDTELMCRPRPAVRVTGRTATGWTVSVLEPTAGWTAAIVGRGPVTRCRSVVPEPRRARAG